MVGFWDRIGGAFEVVPSSGEDWGNGCFSVGSCDTGVASLIDDRSTLHRIEGEGLAFEQKVIDISSGIIVGK